MEKRTIIYPFSQAHNFMHKWLPILSFLIINAFKVPYLHIRLVLSFFPAGLKEVNLRELKEEGFGILTEIDIKETFKKKLDLDFRKYRILGACNPKMAYQAISAESKIGTMLPCNVIVQETEDGKIEVSAVDPVASMTAIENDELGGIAQEVQSKLKTVIERLS